MRQVAAFDQSHQQYGSRATEIEDLVHRCANGSSGVKDVIDQDDIAMIDIEVDLRGLYLWIDAYLGKIVTVEADVQEPAGFLQSKQRIEMLGHPGTAGMDADHRWICQVSLAEPAAQYLGHSPDQVDNRGMRHEQGIFTH